MKIVEDYPPNYKEIIEAIPGAKQSGIVFTYGDTCYNPSKSVIEDHLEAHEMVHVEQQKNGADEWWAEYLKNPKFRLEQEIEAYRVQYQTVLKKYGRADATYVLHQIADDLSGTMYGSILSRKQARKEIIKK